MGHTDEPIPLLADSVSREIMPCDVSEENCFIAEKGQDLCLCIGRYIWTLVNEKQ